MRVARNAGVPVAFGALLVLVSARPAYGYIDPGTGSFVIQVLVGSALGSLLVLKMFWRRIIGAVGRLFGRKPTDPGDKSQPRAQAETSGQRDGSENA